MNKMDINEKIVDIKEKICSLTNNIKLKENNKKMSLLYVKINDYLELINDTIEEYELNNINDYQIDKEINMRIKENKIQKEIIDVFGPYILLYQLSKNTL